MAETVTLSSVHERNYMSFTNMYPDVPSRIEAALELAEQGEEMLEDMSYPSRGMLLAQWGDEDPDLKMAGQFIWGLKERLDTYVGESIVVFRKGARGEDTAVAPALGLPLEVDTGVISDNALVLGPIGDRADEEAGTLLRNIPRPYLRFLVGVPVIDAQRVTIDALQQATVAQSEALESTLVARWSVVSLVDDPETYAKHRRVEQRRLALGNQAATKAVEAMTDLMLDPQPLFNFFDLRRAGALGADKPLPDLSLIFSELAEEAQAVAAG